MKLKVKKIVLNKKNWGTEHSGEEADRFFRIEAEKTLNAFFNTEDDEDIENVYLVASNSCEEDADIRIRINAEDLIDFEVKLEKLLLEDVEHEEFDRDKAVRGLEKIINKLGKVKYPK